MQIIFRIGFAVPMYWVMDAARLELVKAGFFTACGCATCKALLYDAPEKEKTFRIWPASNIACGRWHAHGRDILHSIMCGSAVAKVTINILQTPHRALVSDLATVEQQVPMQAPAPKI